MAVSVSAPVLSLCYNQSGELSRSLGYRLPKKVGFSSGRRSVSYIGFGAEKVGRFRVRVPICRAVPPLLFKDLDADDFRHPFDKQVRKNSPNGRNWKLYIKL